jgi:hypothetical protein
LGSRGHPLLSAGLSVGRTSRGGVDGVAHCYRVELGLVEFPLEEIDGFLERPDLLRVGLEHEFESGLGDPVLNGAHRDVDALLSNRGQLVDGVLELAVVGRDLNDPGPDDLATRRHAVSPLP